MFKEIDARKKALKKKKEYYDYDKTIKKKTDEIELIKQQIRGLEGLTDAESKAQKARLEASLKDKQDDLDDTVRDHVYDITVNGLDDLETQLSEDFEKWSNQLSSDLAKMSDAISNANGKNERTFVSWSGSMLSFGLVSQNGSNEAEIQILPGSQTVTFNGDIGATQGTIYAGSIDATGSLSVRKTARMDILTFYDYQQDTLPTASDMIYRRPIASAASNNGRVAFLQGASGNKISIRAQYGKSDFSSATFTASSSDIRLKEDVKDSSVNALSKIMQMQIREFNWKQTGVHQELGCVADELELIDPLLTTGGGYDDDGTMNIKSIDTLLLSEYAIKGIQELYKQNKHQQKRIEYLESQLKNK